MDVWRSTGYRSSVQEGAIGAWLTIGGLVVFVMWWGPWRTWPGARTQENLQRIRTGMTKAEVRDILGEPSEMEEKDWEVWRYDNRIRVFFGFKTGTVIDKAASP